MKRHPIVLVVDFQFTIEPFSLSWCCYLIFLLLVVPFLTSFYGAGGTKFPKKRTAIEPVLKQSSQRCNTENHEISVNWHGFRRCLFQPSLFFVIRVYDAAGNVVRTHEHTGDFKER
jgi:hypothetical protein